MAEMLLDQIRLQIRDRARVLEPAVRESEQLAAALDALGAAAGPARESAPAVAAKPDSGRRNSARAARPAAKRAPRGANRAAVLGVLAERPGVSVSELTTAAGVARPVLYALLKTLEERGEITKEQLPSGTTGYRLAPGPDGAGSGSRGSEPELSLGCSSPPAGLFLAPDKSSRTRLRANEDAAPLLCRNEALGVASRRRLPTMPAELETALRDGDVSSSRISVAKGCTFRFGCIARHIETALGSPCRCPDSPKLAGSRRRSCHAPGCELR